MTLYRNDFGADLGGEDDFVLRHGLHMAPAPDASRWDDDDLYAVLISPDLAEELTDQQIANAWMTAGGARRLRRYILDAGLGVDADSSVQDSAS